MTPSGMPGHEHGAAAPGGARVADEADRGRDVVERIVAALNFRVLPITNDGRGDTMTRERDTNIAMRAEQRLQPAAVERAPVAAVHEDNDREAVDKSLRQVQIQLPLRIGYAARVRHIQAKRDVLTAKVVVAPSRPEPEQPHAEPQ